MAKINKIVEVLGPYLGIADVNAHKALYEKIKISPDQEGARSLVAVNDQSNAEVSKLINWFQTVGVEYAPSVKAVLEYVKSQAGSVVTNESGQQRKYLDLLANTLIITFEPEGGKKAKENPYSPAKIGITNAYGHHYNMGASNKGVSNDQVVSIKKLMPGGKTTINSKPAAPDNNAPNLAVIQIRKPEATPSTLSSGIGQIFLNSIPTIHMSQCVPYFQMYIVSPFEPGARETGQGIGLIKSLGQDPSTMDKSEDNISWVMASSSPQDVAQALQAENGQAANFGKDNTSGYMNAAGMELFTYPQTLIPLGYDGNYPTYHDPGDLLDPFKQKSQSGQSDPSKKPKLLKRPPILDPLRPLASIQAFDIKVSPTYGIAYKNANLELKIHDKSRLDELAPLIKPAMYASGRIRILVEWGWSYPVGPSTDEAISNNPYGHFLNNLRTRDLFAIQNSSMSFTEDSQVDVNISLRTVAASATDAVKITFSENIADAYKSVGLLVEAIQLIKRKTQQARGENAKDIGGSNFLNSIGSVSAAMNLEEDTIKKIQKYVRANATQNDPTTKNIVNKLQDLFGTGRGKKKLGARFGQIQALKSKSGVIANEIQVKVDTINKTNDPWLQPLHVNAKGKGPIADTMTQTNARRTWVSLAKLLNIFVGYPLASSGIQDEIQFIYYPINSKASWARNLDLAQFPIHIGDFKALFKKYIIKNGPAMSVSSFLQMIQSYFVSNQACRIYGLHSLYDLESDGYKVKDKYEDRNAYDAQVRKVLTEAYGAGSDATPEELTFKLPRMTFQIETVPMQLYEKTTASSKFDFVSRGVPEKYIMRFHISDAQHSPTQAYQQILKSTYDNHFGVISATAAKLNWEKTKTDPAKSQQAVQNKNQHLKTWVAALKHSYDAGVVEPLVMTADNKKQFEADLKLVINSNQNTSSGLGAVKEAGKRLLNQKYQPRIGFYGMKKYMSYMMPTIHIGGNASNVLQADLDTIKNGLMANIANSRALRGSSTSQMSTNGLPVQIGGLKASLSVLGCPFFSFGQEYFIDFKTGTSADNVYRLGSITHRIAPGEFRTDLDFVSYDAYGKVVNMSQTIDDALLKLKTQTDSNKT